VVMQPTVLLHRDSSKVSSSLVVEQLVQLPVLIGLFGNSLAESSPQSMYGG
jgi:hypothetical protein